MDIDLTEQLIEVARALNKEKSLFSSSFNTVNKTVGQIVDITYKDFFTSEYKKPYNEYSIFEMLTLTRSFNNNLSAKFLNVVFLKALDSSNLNLPEPLTLKILDVLWVSESKKQFVREIKGFRRLILENTYYHDLSLIISYLSSKKAVNFGDKNLWETMEVMIAILVLGLIVDDSIHTGHFIYKNPHTKMNHLLEENANVLSKKVLPNWFKKKASDIGYDFNNQITVFQYFMTYQSFFHFYDCMIYKHSLKMFDSILVKQCKYSMWMTNYFRDIDVQILTPGFKIFGIDEIEKINEYTSRRKTIFFQTGFQTSEGNKYLGTELLTENGRKLVTFGNRDDIGQFVAEINLSELDKPGNLKFYTMSFDWQVQRLDKIADKIIIEILRSYVYMALEENGELDRISHIKFNHTPRVLTYENDSNVYESFNVLKSEYRELAPIIRRLPTGQLMSEGAKELADKMHYHVPDGYTFVQGFEKRVRTKGGDDINE